MPLFLLEHIEDCSPLSPCVSCRALTFLRANLKGKAYDEFIQLVRQAHGKEKPAEAHPAIDLKSPWQEVFPNLSTRLRLALINDKMETVGDIVKCTEAQLCRIPNVGDVSVAELKQALASKNLVLAG